MDNKKYQIIYADPPWFYNKRNLKKKDGTRNNFAWGATNHYPVMETKDYKIAKLQDVFPDFSKGFIGIACSFAGKWFGGYARGGTRNYCLESKNNILKQLPNIKDVDFKSVPYNELEIPKNSIIYCDPPYQGTTRYKDSFDHNKFWVWCDILVENGFVVYVSEYNAPDGWKCVWEKEIISNLDLNTGAKRATERLFSK